MINFNTKVLKEIEEYCTLNGLNVDTFANKLLKDAFIIEKYGSRPNIFQTPDIKSSDINQITREDSDVIVVENEKPKKTEQKVRRQKTEENPIIKPKKKDIIVENLLVDDEEEAQETPKKKRKLK